MIAEAKINDLNEIYKMGEKLHQNYRKTNKLEDLLNTNYFKILIYKENDIIKGFLSFSVTEDIIDIYDIYVKEEYRQSHIASILLDYMISNSKINQKIMLEVEVDNIKAINLYQKFNFNIINTRKKYYHGKDAYIMERVNNSE